MATADLDKLAATAARLRQAMEEETAQDSAKTWSIPTEIAANLPPAPPFDGPNLLPKVLCEFDPKPGRQYTAEEPTYITPDVFIHKVGDKYFVVANDDGLPMVWQTVPI